MKFKLPRRYHWVIIGLLIVTGIFSYLTNPFVRFSIVNDPYASMAVVDGQLSLAFDDRLSLRDGPLVNRLALIKSGWHILTGKLSGGRRAQATSVEAIIDNIHALRFNPREPFLISGDHFSVFYPRSLGIFYHSLLDPRTARSADDWLNRQKIYLKSTAYALKVFSQSERLSTTIVPIGPRSVALVNIYAPPSDTLYSLLFALQTMRSQTELEQQYPFGAAALETARPASQAAILTELTNPAPTLQTRAAANQLLDTYRESMREHWEQFHNQVYDESTGLVRTDIRLSGVKDMVKRESAFYDNVIYWKTFQLAQALELIPADEHALATLKQRILQAFWDETEGHFREDLSETAEREHRSSSEWIIAYQVGLLDPRRPEDLPYLERSVAYIQHHELDQPFGLMYQVDQRPEQLYWAVRLSAPEYGSTAIWSNLGQEYVKLLTHLYQVTGHEDYLETAGQQLAVYSFNIKRYQGYPELYDHHGDFFRQRFYKSVRQTGWVVSFEQARAMYGWTRRNQGLFSTAVNNPAVTRPAPTPSRAPVGTPATTPPALSQPGPSR